MQWFGLFNNNVDINIPPLITESRVWDVGCARVRWGLLLRSHKSEWSARCSTAPPLINTGMTLSWLGRRVNINIKWFLSACIKKIKNLPFMKWFFCWFNLDLSNSIPRWFYFSLSIHSGLIVFRESSQFIWSLISFPTQHCHLQLLCTRDTMIGRCEECALHLEWVNNGPNHL